MSAAGARRGAQSWGVGIFLLSVALAGAALYLWIELRDTAADETRLQLVTFGAPIAALAAAWAGRASYPRVHNLRVLLLGIGVAAITAGAVGFVAFVVPLAGGDAAAIAAVTLGAHGLLLALALAGSLAPEAATFAVARWLAFLVTAVILLALAIAASVDAVRTPMALIASRLGDLTDAATWVVLGVAVLVVVASLLRGRDSLGLGGVQAGLAVMAGGVWLSGTVDPLLHGLVWIAAALATTVAIVVHWMRRLENRASYDPLLRIYNRGFCQSVLDGQSSVDTRPPFAIALCDIDHFKAVNDTYGHDDGDAVLQAVAERIQSAVLPEGTVGRWGGEELIVFLPGHLLADARDRMEAVRAAVAATPVISGRARIEVTVSVGVAVRDERDQPMASVVTAADRALYAAKHHGRNQVRTSRLRRKSDRGAPPTTGERRLASGERRAAPTPPPTETIPGAPHE